MRDVDMRPLVLATVRDRHPESDALVVEELDLLGQVRVDVGVVNGAIWGYEIKGARDTLRRLPRQVQMYSRVVDHAALVVARAHLDAAVAMLPSWWEVLVLDGSIDAPFVECRRSGASNPCVDPTALVQLLWRDEAIGLLTERGLDRGVRSKPRRYAWERLVQCFDLGDLQTEVRRCLKARTTWRVPSSRA